MQRILVPALLALAFAVPAAAAPSSTTGTDTSGNSAAIGQNTPATPRIARELRQSLASAGFTDIQVMPQSFLVRAKDKGGNPVMMVINPDSVAAVTAIPAPGASGASDSSSNGSGAGSTTHSSSTGNSTTKQP